MTTTDDSLNRVAEWLVASSRGVVFTGAGISTDSGIPDFRSPTGIWAKYKPVYFQQFRDDPDARYQYWLQKAEGHAEFAAARPNVGHQVIAAWEQAASVRGVVTQNIDGLHQLAGSQQVLELHGNVRKVQCLDCDAQFDAAPLVELFLAQDRVPDCPACGHGRLKHATISFGQSLPADVLQKAAAWCREAEIILAIGSSLVVTPAAELPAITQRYGGRLVIINRDPTPLDSLADAVLRGSISEVLQQLGDAVSAL